VSDGPAQVVLVREARGGRPRRLRRFPRWTRSDGQLARRRRHHRATFAGQLAASVVIDRLGILGLAEREITVERLAGVALLMLGTYLVVR
jgi:hypothetical protein